MSTRHIACTHTHTQLHMVSIFNCIYYNTTLLLLITLLKYRYYYIKYTTTTVVPYTTNILYIYDYIYYI